jgi:hypothetical protein
LNLALTPMMENNLGKLDDSKVEPQFCLALTPAMETSNFDGPTRKSKPQQFCLTLKPAMGNF